MKFYIISALVMLSFFSRCEIKDNEFFIIAGTPWTEFDAQWPFVWNLPQNNYTDVTVFQQRKVDGKLQNNRYTKRRMK